MILESPDNQKQPKKKKKRKNIIEPSDKNQQQINPKTNGNQDNMNVSRPN